MVRGYSHIKYVVYSRLYLTLMSDVVQSLHVFEDLSRKLETSGNV